MSASPAAGVLLPGSDLLHYGRTDRTDWAVGTWAVVHTRWGREGGLIAVPPGRLPEPPGGILPVTLERELTAEEFDRMADLQERALAVGAMVPSLVGDASLQPISGLRLTLDGTLVLSCDRRQHEAVSTIQAQLSARLGVAVVVEVAPDSGNRFGSVGRVARPINMHDMATRRFELPNARPTFAPEGLPRLGSRVTSPSGPGVIVGIDVRRMEARVLLDGGDEVRVPARTLTTQAPRGEAR